MKRAPVSVQRGRMLEGGCSGSGYELLRRSKKAGTRRGHKARKQEIRHVKGGVGLGGLQLAGKKENRAPRRQGRVGGRRAATNRDFKLEVRFLVCLWRG